jgi:hypothetical protein
MSGFCITFLIFLLTVNLPLLSQSSVIRGENGQQAREASNSASGIAVQFDCLPEGHKSTDVVSYREKRKGGDGYITIEDRLVDLKAHCKEGKLIDGKGREIRFFQFACYGNPPSDYDELRQKELEELENLQKKYCVIVMECDPRIS